MYAKKIICYNLELFLREHNRVYIRMYVNSYVCVLCM